MSRTNPPRSDDRSAQEGTALEHDVVKTLTGRDHVARCPDCERETLWSEREHLTHAEDCEVA